MADEDEDEAGKRGYNEGLDPEVQADLEEGIAAAIFDFGYADPDGRPGEEDAAGLGRLALRLAAAGLRPDLLGKPGRGAAALAYARAAHRVPAIAAHAAAEGLCVALLSADPAGTGPLGAVGTVLEGLCATLGQAVELATGLDITRRPDAVRAPDPGGEARTPAGAGALLWAVAGALGADGDTRLRALAWRFAELAGAAYAAAPKTSHPGSGAGTGA